MQLIGGRKANESAANTFVITLTFQCALGIK